MTLEIRNSKNRGRGVFTTKEIQKGIILHKAPVIIEHQNDIGKLNKYCFGWTTDKVAIALGFGSLFNHSERPNAFFKTVNNTKFPEIHFIAKKKIKAGQEIFIDYGDLYEYDWKEKSY